MHRNSSGPVTRWVLKDKQGRFATDYGGGAFVDSLADAYIHVGKPKKTDAVTPVEVTVSIVRNDR